MTQKKDVSTRKLPVLTMRGMVLFPKMVLHFDVGRDKSIYALNEAMNNDRILFLTAQKDIQDEEPGEEEIYRTGIVAEIKQIIKAHGHLRVLVEGRYRARIVELTENEPYLEAIVQEYPVVPAPKTKMVSALVRTLKDAFETYAGMTPRMTKEFTLTTLASEDPLFLVEHIASNLPIHTDDKQSILEESSVSKRLRLLLHILEEEINILSIEQDIQEKVRSQIDTSQREYYLREQMKAISSELGDGESVSGEVWGYHEKIAALDLAEESADRLHKEADRLLKMPSNSHEGGVIKTYLDTCLELPWNKFTRDRLDIGRARRQLDKDHYGMDKIKDRILEMIAVRQLAPDQKGQIICLAGPPGVGKTSIARSVAKAMNRKYVRLSLGGVRDESDIRGHRKTYIGAMPGRIITAMRQAGSSNPLMLLDEVDKLGHDFRGDPSAALLEVLDSEQNHAFRDHYIEIPYDLSGVLFIATANNLDNVPRPLLDRMEIIEMSSYTREEKFHIAREHLVVKQMHKHGLNSRTMQIANSAIYALIDYYTREAGVRSLERRIAALCRKAAKEIVAGEKAKVRIGSKNISEYLGPQKYKLDALLPTDQIGLSNGLAWTSVGGEMLQIEVAVLDGSGKTVLTGNLGDVMKESAHAAISYIRGCAERYNIDKDFYKTKDIHIHIPEGAVPKDGPSAGITICTTVISALAGIPVRRDVAMTGEISLRGRVLPIGGLREKTMAAYRSGIQTVILPEANMPDLDEIDKTVRSVLQFIPAADIKTVLDTALIRPRNVNIAMTKNRKAVLPELEYEQTKDAVVAIQ